MSDENPQEDLDSNKKSIEPAPQNNGLITADELKSGFFALLRRVVTGGESAPFEKARFYPYAFEINEDVIRKIDSRVRECLAILPIANAGELLFRGDVRFPDLSSEKFDNLETLIDKAGDKRDPESLSMQWAAVLIEPLGTVVQVIANFATEQPLETKELQLLDFDLAAMKLEISGPTDIWVEQTYQKLNPFFETVKLSGIYKPLLIFRNRNIVLILSLITALFLDQLVSRILSVYINTPVIVDTATKILSQPSLEEKFDSFIRDLYQVQSPIGTGLAIFGASIVTYVISLILCYLLYPKLVPRSTISIGLAKIRISKYQNAFRFVVFTIIVSGFLIPLLYTLITTAIGIP